MIAYFGIIGQRIDTPVGGDRICIVKLLAIPNLKYVASFHAQFVLSFKRPSRWVKSSGLRHGYLQHCHRCCPVSLSGLNDDRCWEKGPVPSLWLGHLPEALPRVGEPESPSGVPNRRLGTRNEDVETEAIFDDKRDQVQSGSCGLHQ